MLWGWGRGRGLVPVGISLRFFGGLAFGNHLNLQNYACETKNGNGDSYSIAKTQRFLLENC